MLRRRAWPPQGDGLLMRTDTGTDRYLYLHLHLYLYLYVRTLSWCGAGTNVFRCNFVRSG